jgi:hypothetical protein
MIPAERRTFVMSDFVIIGSFTFLGGFFTTSLSTGSTPKLEQIIFYIEPILSYQRLTYIFRKHVIKAATIRAA